MGPPRINTSGRERIGDVTEDNPVPEGVGQDGRIGLLADDPVRVGQHFQGTDPVCTLLPHEVTHFWKHKNNLSRFFPKQKTDFHNLAISEHSTIYFFTFLSFARLVVLTLPAKKEK